MVYPPSPVPDVTLTDGATIPQFGFGVFLLEPAETPRAVHAALEAGYRHIDTAQMYGNEREVGQAVADSGLARDEVFITTKCDNQRHGYDEAISALQESLDKLGTDHVDLYLIHWPLPAKDRYVETWRAFEKLQADGKARSIGVSNFQPAHLDRLARETQTVPVVNQIELHPQLAQAELRSYHRAHRIATEAWSPIGRGKGLLTDPRVAAIADRHGRSAAQTVLRWHIQLGNIVFPKSATPDRIRENIDVFDFELSDEDMTAFAGLEAGNRLGPDPDQFTG